MWKWLNCVIGMDKKNDTKGEANYAVIVTIVSMSISFLSIALSFYIPEAIFVCVGMPLIFFVMWLIEEFNSDCEKDQHTNYASWHKYGLCKEKLVGLNCTNILKSRTKHRWKKWSYTKYGSCNQSRFCECGKKQDFRTEHQWADWQYISNVSCDQTRNCNRCNIKESRVNHHWAQWIIEESSCKPRRVCNRCKQVEIRKLNSYSSNYSCPKCNSYKCAEYLIMFNESFAGTVEKETLERHHLCTECGLFFYVWIRSRGSYDKKTIIPLNSEFSLLASYLQKSYKEFLTNGPQSIRY